MLAPLFMPARRWGGRNLVESTRAAMSSDPPPGRQGRDHFLPSFEAFFLKSVCCSHSHLASSRAAGDPTLFQNQIVPTVHAMPKITPTPMPKAFLAAIKGPTKMKMPTSQIKPRQPPPYLAALRSPLVLT